jgi:hypothetical protein
MDMGQYERKGCRKESNLLVKDVWALVDDAIGDITVDDIKHVEAVESRHHASDIPIYRDMGRTCFMVDSSDEGTATASEGEYSGTTDSAGPTESDTESELN